MAEGKLSQIIGVIYSTIEGLVPHYESAQSFARYTGEDDLSLLDPGPHFRAFRVVPVSVGKGGLQDSSTKRSKAALVEIRINYPTAYQVSGDSSYLGIEVIHADDDAYLVNALCFSRPLSIQTLDDVRSVLWRGSALRGRLWVITLAVEYLETIS
jgi:hypothetical protein